MADVKISALPAATTPLAGTELVPIVQSGVTSRVSVDNLTAGKTVAASTINVDANTASAAVRITQTGAGNALVVEDSANPDATPFVVDTVGRVLIAHTNSVSTQTGATTLQIFGQASLQRYAANSFASTFDFVKSRNATFGQQTIVNNGDALGTVSFAGSDGAAFIPGATISAAVDGTPGTNDMPGRLVFSTTADGASSPTERMRITAAGNVGVGDTNPTPVYGYTNVISVSSNYPGVQFNSAASSTLQKFQIGLGVNSFQFYDGSAAAERMRIDAAGRVGIGTSLPNATLALGNFIAANGFAANQIRVYDDGTNVYGFGVAATILGYRSDNHVFYTNAGSPVERMRITATGNVVAGASVALATTATDGFLYVPTCAGVPTGTPTAITGMAPIVVNTTNNKLYFYSGGAWRDAGP